MRCASDWVKAQRTRHDSALNAYFKCFLLSRATRVPLLLNCYLLVALSGQVAVSILSEVHVYRAVFISCISPIDGVKPVQSRSEVTDQKC